MTRPPLSAGGPLTVVILTLNEAARLPRCLAAIPERHPVLVVDSGSSDATVAIAGDAGCAVIGNPWPGFAAQRNFALNACGIVSPWVLFIDADEIYPRAFFDWFETDGQGRTDFDVAQVPSILIFNGVPLRHAPGYPILHPRLVRRGAVKFVPSYSGHGETVSAGTRQIVLDITYDHHFYEGDLSGWMTKHVRLARQEAFPLADDDGHVSSRARLQRMVPGPFRVLVRFLYHYVVLGGFRDGRGGLVYALMYSWFEMTKAVMRAEAKLSSAWPRDR